MGAKCRTSVILGKQDFEIALCPHCEVHGNHMQMICAQLSVDGCRLKLDTWELLLTCGS